MRGQQGEPEETRVRKAPTWALLGLCALIILGCLHRRLDSAEIVSLAQRALGRPQAAHLILRIEIDTDLIKDSLRVEVWEKPPQQMRVQVLSAETPQFQQLAFVLDGTQSTFFVPHANEVMVGPKDLVRMPAVLEDAVRARRDWILGIDAQATRVLGRERLQGLVVYKLEAPRGQTGWVHFWVDVRDWLVRQITYQDDYLGSGTIIVEQLESLDDLTPEQFVLNFPEGVPVIEVTPRAPLENN